MNSRIRIKTAIQIVKNALKKTYTTVIIFNPKTISLKKYIGKGSRKNELFEFV